MRTLTTCSNPAEASFLQGLLHEQGIEAFVPDQNTIPIGVYQVPLQVDPADYDRAQTILKDFAAAQAPTEVEEPAKVVSPGDDFPFFRIMGAVAVLWVVLSSIRAFFFLLASEELDTRVTDTVNVGVGSIFKGLLIGCAVSWICLLARPLWDKPKKD